jgi:hypothetical protein
MTSDQTSSRQFLGHLPAIGAAAVGAVCAALLGSFLGTAGTMIGMALGSLTSGTVSWWAERGLRRANAVAKAKAEAVHQTGRPLEPHETAAIERSAIAAHDRRDRPRRRHLGAWSVIVLGTLAACVLAVVLIQKAAGQPLSAVVQGHQAARHSAPSGSATPPGTSTGTTSPATSSAAPSATPSPSATSPAPSPDATPDASPSGASSTPGPVQSAVSSAVSQLTGTPAQGG